MPELMNLTARRISGDRRLSRRALPPGPAHPTRLRWTTSSPSTGACWTRGCPLRSVIFSEPPVPRSRSPPCSPSRSPAPPSRRPSSPTPRSPTSPWPARPSTPTPSATRGSTMPCSPGSSASTWAVPPAGPAVTDPRRPARPSAAAVHGRSRGGAPGRHPAFARRPPTAGTRVSVEVYEAMPHVFQVTVLSEQNPTGGAAGTLHGVGRRRRVRRGAGRSSGCRCQP